jgi:two-component system, NtrC family, nitrogen regulation sensor histidine kinase NtrY
MPAADDPARRALPADLGRLLHDLRGPLNSLTMHVEVLKRVVGDDPVAEDSLRTVLEQLGRLSDMLPAAFAVASLELGSWGPVDLGGVAAAARGDARGPVTLAEGRWPSVNGDARLLTVAVGELLRNAVEATTAGAPPPHVSAALEAHEVLLGIRDWGSGVRTTDTRLLIRLLQSTKPGHRGLGLVTVERIARLHGGTLRFSAPGDGTIATLAFPRVP